MALDTPPGVAGAAHAALIERFYAALGRHDAETMIACYSPRVRFADPAFGALDAAAAAAMWRMLCERGKDLAVSASDIEADDTTGHAHWVASYTYSGTGRQVENVIDAAFEFEHGLIVHHVDRFDLYRWARQALGLKGWLFGWLPPVQHAIRVQAARSLAAWRAKHEGGAA